MSITIIDAAGSFRNNAGENERLFLVDCDMCGEQKIRRQKSIMELKSCGCHYGGAIIVEHNGEKKNLTQWSKICGISVMAMSKRYRRGLRSPELFGARYVRQKHNTSKAE